MYVLSYIYACKIRHSHNTTMQASSSLKEHEKKDYNEYIKQLVNTTMQASSSSPPKEHEKKDYNEYIEQLVNTTGSDIHIQIGDEIYLIPANRENELHAIPYYKEIDIGAPYKTFSKPRYELFTPDVSDILESRKGKKTILIVSSSVADAFENHVYASDEESVNIFDMYEFSIQVPNTYPREVVRDEVGAIKAVRSMIHYVL